MDLKNKKEVYIYTNHRFHYPESFCPGEGKLYKIPTDESPVTRSLERPYYMAFVLNNHRTKILELEKIKTNFDFGYRYFRSIKNFRRVSEINTLLYIYYIYLRWPSWPIT